MRPPLLAMAGPVEAAKKMAQASRYCFRLLIRKYRCSFENRFLLASVVASVASVASVCIKVADEGDGSREAF